jgi:hypothetical protein
MHLLVLLVCFSLSLLMALNGIYCRCFPLFFLYRVLNKSLCKVGDYELSVLVHACEPRWMWKQEDQELEASLGHIARSYLKSTHTIKTRRKTEHHVNSTNKTHNILKETDTCKIRKYTIVVYRYGWGGRNEIWRGNSILYWNS